MSIQYPGPGFELTTIKKQSLKIHFKYHEDIFTKWQIAAIQIDAIQDP